MCAHTRAKWEETPHPARRPKNCPYVNNLSRPYWGQLTPSSPVCSLYTILLFPHILCFFHTCCVSNKCFCLFHCLGLFSFIKGNKSWAPSSFFTTRIKGIKVEFSLTWVSEMTSNKRCCKPRFKTASEWTLQKLGKSKEDHKDLTMGQTESQGLKRNEGDDARWV